MFSCSHFVDFLSDDRVGKQSAMPCQKRGQGATSNEGSLMPKPRQQFREGETNKSGNAQPEE